MRLVLWLSTGLALVAPVSSRAEQEISPDSVVRPGAILRAALAPGTTASLKPAAVLHGTLSRPLYDASCRALPQGAAVRAVVDRVERKEKLFPFEWIKLAAGKRREPFCAPSSLSRRRNRQYRSTQVSCALKPNAISRHGSRGSGPSEPAFCFCVSIRRCARRIRCRALARQPQERWPPAPACASS